MSSLYGLLALLISGCQYGAPVGDSSPSLSVNPNQDCVVLLHGLGRTEGSMRGIERELEARGYGVRNIGYPSRKHDIATLADTFVARGVEECRQQGAQRIHFVTHSMGGILLRYYLQQRQPTDHGHVVMLAPPNGGSELADAFGSQFWFRWFLGPAAVELGTRADSTPNSLAPVPGTIGVIAGTGTSAPWMGWLFDGEHDGKVSVDSARLDEMSDFLLVDSGHTAIVRSQKVIDQVAHFLDQGIFRRDQSSLALRGTSP